ncbi:MAG: discoidin domain-containing protein, partial [Propionibacteriaceae bacterium]|nr:discoidin domain-containing protein [Propionibacteriaceae bacterium]
MRSAKRLVAILVLTIGLLVPGIMVGDLSWAAPGDPELLTLQRFRTQSWHADGGSDSLDPTDITDGDPASYWHSNWGTGSGSTAKAPYYIDLDYGSLKSITSIELDKRSGRTHQQISAVSMWIHPEVTDTYPNGSKVTDYFKAGATKDDIDADFAMTGWTPVSISSTGLGGSGTSQTVQITPTTDVESRYVRLQVTCLTQPPTNTTVSEVAVSEIRAFGREAGPYVLPVANIRASSYKIDLGEGKAFQWDMVDDNFLTFWRNKQETTNGYGVGLGAAANSDGYYIDIDLGAEQEVNYVDVFARGNNSAEGWPNNDVKVYTPTTHGAADGWPGGEVTTGFANPATNTNKAVDWGTAESTAANWTEQPATVTQVDAAGSTPKHRHAELATTVTTRYLRVHVKADTVWMNISEIQVSGKELDASLEKLGAKRAQGSPHYGTSAPSNILTTTLAGGDGAIWQPASGNTGYLEVDLGQVKEIRRLELDKRVPQTSGAIGSAQVTLSAQPSEAWPTSYSTAAQTVTGTITTGTQVVNQTVSVRFDDAVYARYLRIDLTGAGGGPSVSQLRVFGTEPPAAEYTLTGSAAAPANDLSLWYREPAKTEDLSGVNADWLPIGNGKLGAMMDGGVMTERIQFNEESLWSG